MGENIRNAIVGQMIGQYSPVSCGREWMPKGKVFIAGSIKTDLCPAPLPFSNLTLSITRK